MLRYRAASALIQLLLLAASHGVAAAAKHSGRGMVLSVDAESRTVVISHDRIDGFMPAMSMRFNTARAISIRELRPGMRVEFRLDTSNGSTLVDRIRPISPAQPKKEDIAIAPPAEAIPIGGAVPDFTLSDQLGNPFRLAETRGRVVAIDFIYTRCPLPDVCPRLSANFARVQRRFAGQPVTLLSITIDPQFDTPPILASYARRWRADVEQWRFLTGPLESVRQIAVRLGMTFWPEDGTITHTSRTLVIDRLGRLAASVEGPSYIVDQLGDLIAHYLEK